MKCKKQMILTIMVTGTLLFLATSSNADTAIVNTDTLKLRKEASTNATVLELLNEGEKLEVIEQSGDWVKVKAKNMTGYVHKDYVKIQKTENTQTPQTNTVENENTTVTEPQNEIKETTNTVTEEIPTNENNPTTTQNKEESFQIRTETLKTNTKVFILPLINAITIADLNSGAEVMIMDEVTNWVYVQTQTMSGWVLKSALTQQSNTDNPNTTTNTNPQGTTTTTETEQKETPVERKVMYVNYSSIYVRKGPSTEEEVVDSLVLNAQVTVIAEVGDWYKVEVGNTTGYIAKRLLSASKTEETTRNAEEREESNNDNQVQTPIAYNTTTSKGQEIVNYAKQYLGCKYVYGGSGPSNFDCSGFTMYVYQHFGISLSHSARAQANNGSYVTKNNLQLGDLVFFKDYQTMDGIGHCGIYIGDGNFIHASSGTGYCVKISTLLSGSYATRYETARRLI